MRFIHTADWQIGMTRHFLGRSGGEAQARFAEARLDAVRALGALADAQNAAFVLVCGDVFESNLVGPEVVARAAEALRTFRTPVLLLPGNHDPADAAAVLRRPELARRTDVTVLDAPGVHRVAPGIEVVAAPWSSKRPLSDLVADQVGRLAPPPHGTVRIVAGHGALDGLRPDPSDPAAIRLAGLHAALDDGRAHYVALGDRHSTWSDPTGRVRYSGAPEVTDHDEVDPGNVLVVDVEPGRLEVRTEHVGRWRFVRHQTGVDTDADLDALDAWLTARTDKERTAVRLGLVGTLTVRQRSRLDDLLVEHGRVFAAVETSRRRSHLVTRPDDDDLDTLRLGGFAAAAARELHAGAADEGPDGDTARDALGLLHRLAAR